ncbi:MAG: hypothetical protein ABI704_25075 [Kofleriaceae bacterium]
MSDDLDLTDDLTDDEQQLVSQLHALPAEGTEPDWAVLEREVRLAVGPQVPTSWWRKLRWLVPVGAIVTGLALALLVMNHRGIALTEPTATPPVLPVEQPTPDTTALWLDGHAVEVDDDFDPSTLYDDDGSEELADDSHALLPVDNLQWIDSLDDRALDRAEHWLDHEKHKKG